MKNFLISFVLLLVVCTTQLWGQANTLATVTGHVVDENKEPVPGATVVITNKSTGFSSGSLSSVDG